MILVDVLLLVPHRQERLIYTYALPPGIQEIDGAALYGRRALIPVGKRRQEGIILGPASAVPPGRVKDVISILDQEAVITPALMELAEWMALQYATSLNQVIHGIIPAFLRHRKGRYFVPGPEAAAFLVREDRQQDPVLYDFLIRLVEEEHMDLRSIRTILNESRLDELVQDGFIISLQDYGFARERSGGGLCLAREVSSEEIEVLAGKAPRQAEFIRSLQASGGMTMENARRQAGNRIVKVLQEKGLVKIVPSQPYVLPEAPFELGEAQELAIASVLESLQQRVHREFLLWGITGSGKTEVYINLSQQVLAGGGGVLLLVPEIALTRQLLATFEERIGNVAVLHSAMPATERYEIWLRIVRGQSRMVIGARSAIFAPVDNLQLLIIDEEQENSYKQEESPRYHVRDIARKRAEYHSAVLLLGSATPAVETFYRGMNGQAELLVMKQRMGGGEEPSVILDDLKQYRGQPGYEVLSPLLVEKMAARLAGGEQVILFLNRRGYRPMTMCRACGRSRICPQCSVSLNFHRDRDIAVCHYCGYQEKPGQSCVFCGSEYMQMAGFGTQTVEEEASRHFPTARVARLDTDSSQKRGEQERILKAMRSGTIDILVGTQMVAKGLDFPMVSLVGVLGADQMLGLPDFRAGERAFQLIVQAAGRAGRSMGGAEVVVQTFNPNHPVIRMAAAADYFSFYMEEIKQRQLLGYPPFTHLLRAVLSSVHEDLCQKTIADIIEYARELNDARENHPVFLGPAECPIYKIRNRYRYQFVVKSPHEEQISGLARYLAELTLPEDVRLELDINPLTLM